MLVIPFTREGPSFGGNHLGFDFGHVMVSLKQPDMCFALSGNEGKPSGPPNSFTLVALLYYLNLVSIM